MPVRNARKRQIIVAPPNVPQPPAPRAPFNRDIRKPVSIGGLADHLGVSRQRVYTLIQTGKIKASQVGAGLVIQPEEVARITDAAVRISTRTGRERVVFDFV